MSDALLLWETWHRWQGQEAWRSPVYQINDILDSQRRFQLMLADEDVADDDIYYSQEDLRIFIEKCRNDARTKLIVACSDVDESTSPDYILHAAAKIKLSPQNTAQLITDYLDLISSKWDGSLPLHFATAAAGISDHMERVKLFLHAHPDAIKRVDERGMLPLHIALVCGADFDVIKLLIEAFPPALDIPFLPRRPVIDDLVPLIGLLPFHIACCQNYSLDVIFYLLLESPDCIKGTNCFDLGKWFVQLML